MAHVYDFQSTFLVVCFTFPMGGTKSPAIPNTVRMHTASSPSDVAGVLRYGGVVFERISSC